MKKLDPTLVPTALVRTLRVKSLNGVRYIKLALAFHRQKR